VGCFHRLNEFDKKWFRRRVFWKKEGLPKVTRAHDLWYVWLCKVTSSIISFACSIAPIWQSFTLQDVVYTRLSLPEEAVVEYI